MSKRKNPAAVQLGRKGGKARASNMTPEQRSESARKAGKARAAKAKAAKGESFLAKWEKVIKQSGWPMNFRAMGAASTILPESTSTRMVILGDETQ